MSILSNPQSYSSIRQCITLYVVREAFLLMLGLLFSGCRVLVFSSHFSSSISAFISLGSLFRHLPQVSPYPFHVHSSLPLSILYVYCTRFPPSPPLPTPPLLPRYHRPPKVHRDSVDLVSLATRDKGKFDHALLCSWKGGSGGGREGGRGGGRSR